MLKAISKKIFHNLSKETRYEIFYQAARSLGIRGYVVDGTAGPFLGAVADRAIMRTYFRSREWSPELMTSISSALVSGGSFVDVGANIGLVSIAAAKLDRVNVYALEPDEENYNFLLANIAMHNLKNIQTYKVAAWHEDATLRFSKNSYNSGDHHINTRGEIEVSARPIDFLEIPEGNLVIKIDTQGAEPSVLQGGLALLSRAQLVILEFWPWGMARMGQDPQNAIAALCELQFGGKIVHNGKVGPYLSLGNLCDALTEIAKVSDEYLSWDLMLQPSQQ